MTGKQLPQTVITAALQRVHVGWDPYASSVGQSAAHAVAVGLLPRNADLHGMYDLAPLNAVLRSQKLATVTDDGLGSDGRSR